MFEIKNVSKSYGKKNAAKAVDNISLTVNNGEIFGFLGPNGAGKTTTIRMLTGILQADNTDSKKEIAAHPETDIILDGISMLTDPISAKHQFAFVPDNPETFSRLKAIEYLNFICDIYKINDEERKSQISFYCEKFGLSSVLKNKINTFSHGMKQKLFLIASLITNPQNWILDEPMVGLDPEAAFIVKEIMRERAAAGKTVFFSTHVMEVAEKLCDRIGIIKEGKIVFTGTLEELRATAGSPDISLEDIFLKMVGITKPESENKTGTEKNMEAQN